MKSKLISELKNGLGFPRSKGEPQVPRTRGEVAAQEQIRAIGQTFATKGEPRAPTNRGEVAAQERLRIIGQATQNVVKNRKTIEAK